MRKRSLPQTKLMARFSTLAGPIESLEPKGKYRVSYRSLVNYDKKFYQHWTRFVAYGALVVTIGLTAMLLQPAHWVVYLQPASKTTAASWLMLGCLILLQLFVVVGTFAATRSTLKARDPIPVRPPTKKRVAFATTRAPGEPIEMVFKTLEALKHVRYRGGTVDVWLLDETNDPELHALTAKLRVRYFTRNGVAAWNTVKQPPKRIRRLFNLWLYSLTFGAVPKLPKYIKANPYLAARSKHGNFNSWRAMLRQEGINYDFLAGVDTDQVPEPNFLERTLGYFRDEDVAYVVGPQVYGNYKPGLSGLVARWAESQASFFQSTIQRAGNATGSPMFVGTNYVVRMPVLEQIGGMQPCITEDMATGLAIHSSRNPATGKRWKSVYTPDVLAVGEGPDFWSPFFTQQWRWAAGTFDTWRRKVWRVFFKLSPSAGLHYMLMLTYYPMAALTWLLGIISSATYLVTGSTAILVPWAQFISVFMMSIVMQNSLYIWNRRYNVSPHESQGSYGFGGIAMSTFTGPVYLSAFVGMLINKKVHFVVTKKGDTSTNPDWLQTFRIHIQWAVLLVVLLIYGLVFKHSHPAMLAWVVSQLAICLVPLVLGMSVAAPQRLRKQLTEQQPEVVAVGDIGNA